MSVIATPVSDMAITVKSREVQRALQSEMRGQKVDAKRHFLAAAHLELVLADDFERAGDSQRWRRSIVSSASCFWRAGDIERATEIFSELMAADPLHAAEIQEVMSELQTQSGINNSQ